MDACKWTCLILLLFFLKATRSNEWRTVKGKTQIDVYDVVITEETYPAHLNYSNVDKVVLWNPKINTFTTEMQSQILDVRYLSLQYGIVPTVHVAPHFKHYQVWNCSTSNVIINPNISYETDYFGIMRNKLEKVPKHLNVMKKMKFLYLHDNQIEFVDMADFNGLNNLEIISLKRNKIHRMSANQVVLPKLIEFAVEDNRLSSINFEYWNAMSLQKIWFNQNRLSIALAFPSKFPYLKVVGLSENPFNCQWLNATLKELKSRKVAFYKENLITCSKEEETLDEFRKIKFQKTFATRQELENTNSKLESSIDKLTKSVTQSQVNQQQTNSELKKIIQEYNQEVNILKLFQKTATAEIDQLKHKDDDLTETLYLLELAALKDSHQNGTGN